MDNAPPPPSTAVKRALAIGAEASRLGFDWPDASGPLSKVAEELAELQEAFHEGDVAHVRHELGDVLFSVVNFARHLRMDPEEALEGTNERFSRRFRWLQAALAERGQTPHDVSPEELESLWQAAKNA